MKFIPHQYQEFASGFIRDHPESLMILDMGLGKTVISLTAILNLVFDRFEVGKVLVIGPLRVCSSVWPEELRKWDGLDFLQMSVMVGDAKQRAAALRAPADVYVINRENVKWLVDELEKHGLPWPFDMVVIDELSSFKNHQSQRWRALRKVRPYIKRIVGLTGTPASNGLMDLWAEVFLIDGGERLGRFIGQYRETFFRAAGMNPHTGVVYSYMPLPGAEAEIYRRIADVSVSMKAKDYLRMPECVTVTHEAVMDSRETELYETMKRELLITLEDDVIDAANAAVLSGKLLQMANGAVYSENHEMIVLHDRKLEILSDLIEQANGQNVLVAYWYRHDHERIRKYLTEMGYEPRNLKTEADIRDWNAGGIRIGLISPASAGHGLNIQQGGHILIWFSMEWSLELYQQTNARLWRQGQRNVVTIHHIVTKGTVDEDVLEALKRKESTQENLISAVKARLTEERKGYK